MSSTVRHERLDDVLNRMEDCPGGCTSGAMPRALPGSGPAMMMIALCNSSSPPLTSHVSNIIQLNVDVHASDLEETMVGAFVDLVKAFLEGRTSLMATASKDEVLIELDRHVNAGHVGGGSWFDRLKVYTPRSFLDAVAQRLASPTLDVAVVDDPPTGVLLRKVL